jgi:hypothetical protein
VPAWNTPSSRPAGTPHPGGCPVDWPNTCCHAGGLGHGAGRAIDQKGAMAMPAPVL